MPSTATMPEPAGGAPAGGAGATRALHPGARLGDYRLLAPVGAGGMANVWAAARTGDYGFERLFAVKVMRDEIAQDAAFRRMFLEEAKVSARIHHTNVVDVIDLGEDGGTVYQVMPLVEGDSLARLVRAMEEADPGARVPRSVAARVVVDALRGLHAAHETRDGRDGRHGEGAPLGIVHRDVSPQNILVGVDGVAKIADFGVAKVKGSLAEDTETGAPKGKVSYMSPEQLRKAELDRRSDLFSAGVVLWELLAGARLTPSAASSALSREPIADPASVDPTVPPALVAVTMRALAAAADDRYASADAMADALEEAARGCGLALSTKEVSSWASALATRTLTRRREQLAEAMGTIGAAATVSEVAPAAAGRARVRRGAIVFAAAALVIAIAALRFRAAPAPPARSASVPAAVREEPAMSASPAPPVSASAVPLIDAPPAVVSAASSSSAAPRARAPAPRSHKPAPRPRFANPYGP